MLIAKKNVAAGNIPLSRRIHLKGTEK